MRLFEKVDLVTDVFGNWVEIEVPLLLQIIILLLVINNLTGEEFHDVAEGNFIALVWIQNVQEVVRLLIQILLEAVINRCPVRSDVRNLQVHSRVQVNELRI